MRYLNGLLLALMLMPLTSMAQSFTGSWEYHGPAESGMWLKTEQHGKNVRFQLELQRGAPSYNSGWIEGEFQLQGTEGVFSADADSGRCEIRFQFSQKNMSRSVKPTRGINVALATTYMPLESYASKVNTSRSSRTATRDFNSRTSASFI